MARRETHGSAALQLHWSSLALGERAAKRPLRFSLTHTSDFAYVSSIVITYLLLRTTNS